MEKSNKTVALIIASALLAVVLGLLAFGVFRARVSAEESADGFVPIKITVTNNINDFAFELEAKYNVSFEHSAIEFVLSAAEVASKKHYFNQVGYQYDESRLGAYSLGADGSTWRAYVRSIADGNIVINYVPRSYKVTFYDTMSDSILGSVYTVPNGGSVTPPLLPDYTAQGFVFVGWSGGSYENVTKNVTLYAEYAAARFVTVILPDKSELKKAVAYGSTIGDLTLDDWNGKKFKGLKDPDTGKFLPDSQVVDYDITAIAQYGGIRLSTTWQTVLWSVFGIVGGIAVAAVTAILVIKIKRRKLV